MIFTAGNDTQIIISEYCPTSSKSYACYHVVVSNHHLDKISAKFKSDRHTGSIHDIAICENFLVTVGGFGELYLWKILATSNRTILACVSALFQAMKFIVWTGKEWSSMQDCYQVRLLLGHQKFQSKLVDARIVNNLVLIAVATSYAAIKWGCFRNVLAFSVFRLLKYGLDGRLSDTRSVELDGVLSYSKVCFVNDHSLVSATTGGHLICYNFDETDMFIEVNRRFVEQNSLTALCSIDDSAIVGSTAGRISAVKLNSSDDIPSQLAHGSTVTGGGQTSLLLTLISRYPVSA